MKNQELKRLNSYPSHVASKLDSTTGAPDLSVSVSALLTLPFLLSVLQSWDNPVASELVPAQKTKKTEKDGDRAEMSNELGSWPGHYEKDFWNIEIIQPHWPGMLEGKK